MASRIDSMSPEACREYYAKIRLRSEARSAAAFDAACIAYMREHGLLGAEGTCGGCEDCSGEDVCRAAEVKPADLPAKVWVKVAREVRFQCKRCAGTGQFITYVENGVPRGPGGACFRCNGQGSQNDHDVRRNEEHDKHYIARAAC